MTLLLNVLWFVLGGFASGCAWLLGAVLLAITIVGLPWAAAAVLFTTLALARARREGKLVKMK